MQESWKDIENIILKTKDGENFIKEIKPIIDGMLGSDIFLRLAGESVGDGKSETNYKVEIDELNDELNDLKRLK